VSLPAATPIPESRGHVEVRQLIDDIDLNNATKLYREVLDGMSHDAIGLVVDLSEVRHIDSTGIRMLHQLAGWLAQQGQELRVVVPADSSFRRVLSLSCFDAHLPLTSTADSAVLEVRRARDEVTASDLVAE
jgi:anti-anti-sigma factor